MALASSGITIGAVKAALGTSNTNLGELCINDNINVWSKWKPINSSASTLTIDILKSVNYGIGILLSNSVTNLYNDVVANGNMGYFYIKPVGGARSPYRLGDFRNYDHSADIPLNTTYNDGDTVNIGGVTSSNHSAYKKYLQSAEVVDPEDDTTTYLTKNDIYPMTDIDGNTLNLKRGALITDGTNTYWSTEYIPWAESNWQKFKDKTVTVFEFLTNVDNNPDNIYTASAEDRFYALPEPVRSISVTSNVPSGSRVIWCLAECVFTDQYCEQIEYSLTFSAVGDAYRGGTIRNVHIGYYEDDKGLNPIASTKIADSITVAKDTTSETYTGTLNNPNALKNGFILVFWNNSVQHKTQVMQDVMEQ